MSAQSLLEQLPQEDPDYGYNVGCLLYQDGKHEEACKKFSSAMQVLGYVPGQWTGMQPRAPSRKQVIFPSRVEVFSQR